MLFDYRYRPAIMFDHHSGNLIQLDLRRATKRVLCHHFLYLHGSPPLLFGYRRPTTKQTKRRNPPLPFELEGTNRHIDCTTVSPKETTNGRSRAVRGWAFVGKT